MKDFYDICIMFRTMEFDIEILLQSIRASFIARGNALPADIPTIFTEESINDPVKNTQWNAFVKRSALAIQIGNWKDVVSEVRRHFETIFVKLGVTGV